MRHFKAENVDRSGSSARPMDAPPLAATKHRRALGDYLFSGAGFSVSVGALIAGLALTAAFMKAENTDVIPSTPNAHQPVLQHKSQTSLRP